MLSGLLSPVEAFQSVFALVANDGQHPPGGGDGVTGGYRRLRFIDGKDGDQFIDLSKAPKTSAHGYPSPLSR